MLLTDRIKQLREEKQLFQRHLAEALEIDVPMYCRIERGERSAKREYVIALAKILNTNETELLTLWLADKILGEVEAENELADKALEIAQQTLKNK